MAQSQSSLWKITACKRPQFTIPVLPHLMPSASTWFLALQHCSQQYASAATIFFSCMPMIARVFGM
jgi:hypothetical protein